ncbi:leucine Rich repeat-containing domain protein [Ancylostoma ceylanicum]|uniref:Leucine Rich repeat-containing domain protein n=1 Tax=Ancylostoma ceylanicum TaxID=53326 RepID=A0A0D6MBD4_9BILA|nr:leucine Rich repeat-containing domain protein [Ancylostoma ceylanicum]
MSYATTRRFVATTTLIHVLLAAAPALGQDDCDSMHARVSGLNLVCCSLRHPVIDSCEYSSLCNTEHCECHLNVGKEFSCDLDEPEDATSFVWRDHHQHRERLSCTRLNLPNRGHPYKVTIQRWNETLTPTLVMGLVDSNVTELRIHDIDETTPLVDLAKYTPHLRSLEFSTRERQPIDVFNTFRHLKVLENLRIINVDVDFSRVITALAAHTFALCTELRVLDLSQNPVESLPYKPFFRNSKLKWIKLSGTRITRLGPEHFAGLGALKSLTLSYTPLISIDPFAFLPLKSLKTLDLEATNITAIPSAVIQNCGLTHLNAAHNMLHRRSSLPPEVIALLSGLSQLKLDGNPLIEFPPSLFLLSTDNFRLIRQLFQTMTSLPVWTEEPSSSYRQLTSSWSEERMEREGLSYCREQYEWMIEEMEIYRDLEKNSGCSANRRLRSAALAKKTVLPCEGNSTNTTSSRKHGKLAVVETRPDISNLLLASLIANIQQYINSSLRYLALIKNADEVSRGT